tara:strand:- start:63257 stop:66679 length:3423 start_codon:yes stop_codon:yes gene_type:complete
MAKVRIDKLPEGFELRDGKIVETMKSGGYVTGDQRNWGLVTVPPLASDGSEIGRPASEPKLRYSLNPVPRDEATVEAEKGETVLTDLNEDGKFELYKILGKRHTGGGTPLNLPPQSFIYSDTAKARLPKAQLAELGISAKKKITPAVASMNFELNPYVGVLADPTTDKIGEASAELMLDKNKHSLSHLAFLQESRKKFKEGVPLASHPYLVSQGQDPIEFSMEVEELNRKEAEDAAIAQLPPEEQEKMLMLRQFMEQAQAQGQQQAQQQGMQPPMEAQGQPMQQQMQPPPEMAQQQMAPQGQPMPPEMMARYGGEYGYLPKAQDGIETIDNTLPPTDNAYKGLDLDTNFNIFKKGEISPSPLGTLSDDSYTTKEDSNVTDLGDDYNIKAVLSDESKIDNLIVGEGGDWIDKIIDYELQYGSPTGGPLTISAAFKLPTGADREAARKKIEQDYLPGYENYPSGLKERVVDFHVNSEDPRGSLMVASNLITAAQKVDLYYTKDEIDTMLKGQGLDPESNSAAYKREYKKYAGKLNPTKVDPLWKKHKTNVEAVISTPEFINRFDAEKHRSYRNTNGADTSYEVSWGPRVDMWNDDWTYDSWSNNKYYTKTGNGYKRTDAKQPVSPLDPSVVTPAATSTTGTDSDWLKGYNKYEEYWNSEENKEGLDFIYEQYKDRATASGEVPLDRDKFDELWLRDQKQKRYLASLPEDEVMSFQTINGKQVYDLNTSNKDGRYEGVNWKYKELMKGMEGEEALIEDEVLHTQLMHQAGMDAERAHPEFYPNMTFHSEGEPIPGTKEYEGWGGADPKTSVADRFLGNKTIKQYNRLKVTPEEEPTPVAEETGVEEQLDINVPPLGRTAELPEAEFWLQDMIGMGTAISNKNRINKYYPWAPMINKPTMEPVFDDPTRRIAAINEQKTISDQARAMYSGPQSLAAFTGKSSGQAMKGIADTVDRVNRYNVDTANKFAMVNANADLSTQQLNNATRTKLYNDTMLVEQNYDNAMAQADTEIARQIQNAFTNRANTYNMNTLYDQYNVRPGTGGVIEFTNPRDPWPTDSRGEVDKEKQYFDFMQRHMERNPNQTASTFPAFKWIQGDDQSTGYGRPGANAMMMQGYPMGMQPSYNAGYQGGYGHQPGYSGYDPYQ